MTVTKTICPNCRSIATVVVVDENPPVPKGELKGKFVRLKYLQCFTCRWRSHPQVELKEKDA